MYHCKPFFIYNGWNGLTGKEEKEFWGNEVYVEENRNY